MKGVTKAAKKANGLSHMCHLSSQARKNMGHPLMSRVCSDAFVEGYKKGVKAVEKAIKESTNQLFGISE